MNINFKLLVNEKIENMKMNDGKKIQSEKNITYMLKI